MQQNEFLSGGILCYTDWLEMNGFGLFSNFLKNEICTFFYKHFSWQKEIV